MSLTHDEVGVFDRAFWAFGPCIIGFLYCRSMLCIDGTHLYGKYKGTLLVATVVDAYDSLFPLAYAIVEFESCDSWGWFFSCMREFIYTVRGQCIKFISNQMKGILKALVKKWRKPHKHGFCARHLKANLQAAGFRDKQVTELFYSAACALEVVEYMKIREEIKATNRRANEWIERSLVNFEENWALCKDDRGRFQIMTTNALESFNSVLKGARSLPIKALVARTFFRSIEYFCKQRQIADELTTRLTPKWKAKIAERASEAHHCRIIWFSLTEWQVIHYFGDEYKVTIEGNNYSSTCNIPLLQKLPCAHVMTVCSAQASGANRAHHDFASQWYTIDSYKGAYKPKFHPMHDKRYWRAYNDQPILPPTVKRQPRRPRSTRIKGTVDEGRSFKLSRCNKCRSHGHNRKRSTTVV